MTLEKNLTSIALFFATAASAQGQQTPPPAPAPAVTAAPVAFQTPSETLWKTEFLDTVIAVRTCPDSGMCGYLYWLNPKDKKIYEYFGAPEDKSLNQMLFNSYVDENDVRKQCGMSPRMSFKKVAENRWQGTMEMRGYNMDVNVDVRILSDRELAVVTSKGPKSERETWRRIDHGDPKYPKCVPVK